MSYNISYAFTADVTRQYGHKLSNKSIRNALGRPCNCGSSCSENWTFRQVFDAREITFRNRNRIKDTLYRVLEGCFDSSRGSFFLTANGQRVCRQAWLDFYGYSTYLYYIIRRCILDNKPLESIHGNSLRRYSCIGRQMIHSWMKIVVNIVGDSDPTCSAVYLPPGVTKIDVYDSFVHDQRKAARDSTLIPSSRYFYQVWKKDFPTVKVTRHNTLGVCDVCAEHDKEYSEALSINDRKAIRSAKRAHLDDVMNGILSTQRCVFIFLTFF